MDILFVHMCAHMCVWMHMEAKYNLGCHSSVDTIHLYLWDQVSHWLGTHQVG